MAQLIDKYLSGTSGLLLPVANKSLYPVAFQDKSRLNYYASLYSSIEINSSFYKIPQGTTMKKWAGDVPQNFKFTFKLFKEITHAKNLQYDRQVIKKFFGSINQVGDKKGCLLLQFPGSFKVNNINRLGELLNDIRLEDPHQHWKIAVEFRNADWYVESVIDFLEDNNCTLVVHDKGGYGTGFHDTNTDCVYVRFHGPGGSYRGSYDESYLSEFASYIQQWIEGGKTVYVYFNNTMGEAIQNMELLRSLVQENFLIE